MITDPRPVPVHPYGLIATVPALWILAEKTTSRMAQAQDATPALQPIEMGHTCDRIQVLMV